MAIHYLPIDERLTAAACAFVSIEPSKQPLLYTQRLTNLKCWRGVPASHIRDGLHMTHLEPRHNYRVLMLNLKTGLPTTKRRSYVQRMTRYARRLAEAKALLSALPHYTPYVPCEHGTPF